MKNKAFIFFIGLMLLYAGCTANEEKQVVSNSDDALSNVYGQVVAAESQFPVKGANVSAICKANGAAFNVVSDEKGYYSINLTCPSGSEVLLNAFSAGYEVCFSGECRAYNSSAGVATALISDEGFGIANIEIR
jgi:phosphatidate phosphatase APP1